MSKSNSKREKIELLRAKTTLSRKPDYSRVYIRSSQTHEERLIRLNTQALLNLIPNGSKYRIAGSGRLVEKDIGGTQGAQAMEAGMGRGARPKTSQQGTPVAPARKSRGSSTNDNKDD